MHDEVRRTRLPGELEIGARQQVAVKAQSQFHDLVSPPDSRRRESMSGNRRGGQARNDCLIE
jgi:hypothetical protein